MNVLQEFSDGNGIDPDCRPLHAYRLSETQYLNLGTKVKECLRSGRYRSVATAFVLSLIHI